MMFYSVLSAFLPSEFKGGVLFWQVPGQRGREREKRCGKYLREELIGGEIWFSPSIAFESSSTTPLGRIFVESREVEEVEGRTGGEGAILFQNWVRVYSVLETPDIQGQNLKDG
jgi:hypothetical protein